MPRIFKLFRGLGLRHLVVVNRKNEVNIQFACQFAFCYSNDINLERPCLLSECLKYDLVYEK